MGLAGCLLDLETAAWKNDRRFRILSIDGSRLAFSDLFFHTPNKPLTQAGPPSPHWHSEAGFNYSITGGMLLAFEDGPVKKAFMHFHEKSVPGS